MCFLPHAARRFQRLWKRQWQGAFPSVPGRLRAKSKPVTTTRPARPAQRLEMLRLEVPQGAAKHAEILGTGPEAAPAVVEMLQSIGAL